MQPIIYDVAVSIDGYIAGQDGDVSRFPHVGPMIEDYLTRLSQYATAIMGRGTYEFGYRYGMARGENPYPHMKTIVFSASLRLPPDSDVDVRAAVTAEVIEDIRAQSAGPVYLAGGGQFAASLLALNKIDILRLKRAPILLGSGTPLFNSANPPLLEEKGTRHHVGGLIFQEFSLVHV